MFGSSHMAAHGLEWERPPGLVTPDYPAYLFFAIWPFCSIVDVTIESGHEEPQRGQQM